MELVCFANKNEQICLKFYPCRNLGKHISWDEWHRTEPLIIYYADYNALLLERLRDIFPLANPSNGNIQECFDVCFDNWIGRDAWCAVIEKIKNDMSVQSDERVAAFYQTFVEWCESQLNWAEIIVVEGNQ